MKGKSGRPMDTAGVNGFGFALSNFMYGIGKSIG